ncbi:hypothetical protein [Spiroplasma alleghenense]|uniref:Uncharacterized protein n=1 Tax=Spiroplasma alleghenense TaxID=216931 RepID=A0A345Z544_9MOLU|nr:hypothetical protein [Spiroplasma alleghenense]AXK51723.1 hypothetical protein SALLE_v1c10530 [Spiroplasma alleghenense]
MSGNNEDEAIRKLQERIDLQARYVHQDEIANWNNKTISFENVISDGIYTTHRKKINNQYMFFLNQHDAYNALTGAATSETTFTKEVINVYVYLENKNGSYIQHSYSNDSQLDELARKILNNSH